jgi:hypothetical protein
VIHPAVTCPKPSEFGSRGDQWLDDGWLVDVAFQELGTSSIRPSEHMGVLSSTLPDLYSPIRANGVGNQMYLAPVPRAMSAVLMSLIGPGAATIVDDISAVLFAEFAGDNATADIEDIEHSAEIGETERQQLIYARRGQGLFRAGVGLIEKRCRITQTTNKLHLVASHIKPWKNSDNQERLSRYNGLFLSPHVDHLFDNGYLSFQDDGAIIVSSKLDVQILDQWHIAPTMNVGSFQPPQRPFLEFHRDVVLIP